MDRVVISLFFKVLLKLKSAFYDLLPIILVVAFFQLVVLQQPFPNLGDIIVGLVLVVLGLMFFIEGLEIGLFPIGENLSYALTKKGSVFWLLLFAFLLGFSTTVAEPALIAIAKEASRIAVEGNLILTEKEISYAFGLRMSVAFSVGLAVVIGVLRIIKGWPIYYLIIGGYILVMLMTTIAPEEIIGIAYDAGGVTTSTITVPLVTALGVGLATVIKGRSPLTDGFGIIALASLLPMIFVMAYGMLVF
ncbi:MAG: DUF1538 family protein [Flavobacteriales bacterium]